MKKSAMNKKNRVIAGVFAAIVLALVLRFL